MFGTIAQRKVEKLEKCSSTEREQVSASAQTMIRDYAAIRWPSLNHKGRVASLARVLGFGHRRVKSIYHNELGIALRADELAAIEALRRGQNDALRASQDSYRTLEARIAALEAYFAVVDEEFGREQLAGLRASFDGASARVAAGGGGNGPAGDEDPTDFSD